MHLTPGIYRINGVKVQLLGRATVFSQGDIIEAEADYQQAHAERIEHEEREREYQQTRHDRWLAGVE